MSPTPCGGVWTGELRWIGGQAPLGASAVRIILGRDACEGLVFSDNGAERSSKRRSADTIDYRPTDRRQVLGRAVTLRVYKTREQVLVSLRWLVAVRADDRRQVRDRIP